jgi:hypothetical protein
MKNEFRTSDVSKTAGELANNDWECDDRMLYFIDSKAFYEKGVTICTEIAGFFEAGLGYFEYRKRVFTETLETRPDRTKFIKEGLKYSMDGIRYFEDGFKYCSAAKIHFVDGISYCNDRLAWFGRLKMSESDSWKNRKNRRNVPTFSTTFVPENKDYQKNQRAYLLDSEKYFNDGIEYGNDGIKFCEEAVRLCNTALDMADAGLKFYDLAKKYFDKELKYILDTQAAYDKMVASAEGGVQTGNSTGKPVHNSGKAAHKGGKSARKSGKPYGGGKAAYNAVPVPNGESSGIKVEKLGNEDEKLGQLDTQTVGSDTKPSGYGIGSIFNALFPFFAKK